MKDHRQPWLKSILDPREQRIAGSFVVALACPSHAGEKLEASATGDGMVEAACTAIKQATGIDGRLTDYAVTSVTGGVDALADVALRFEVDGISMPGRGLSTDVVEASARAFLNAINRITRVRDSGEDPRLSARPGSLEGV